MTPYEQFRRIIRDLNLDAQRDLQMIWRSVGGDPAALAEILAELVQTYGEAAAALSADWYDELRADTGVRPGFRAIVPEPREPGTSALVGWAAAEATTEDAFRSLIAGGIQKRITNYSRNTLVQSSLRDPRAKGWIRTGHGACGWCAMLISRSVLYTREDTADFAAHDHCNCGVAPAWAPDQIKKVRDEFVPSARRRSEETKAADVARAKRWIENNL